MREAVLKQFLELNDLLTTLNEQSDPWLDNFAQLWRIDISFLRRYNSVVLTWITAWKE